MARPISSTTKFILSHPHASTRELLLKASAQGIVTSESNVHRVRRAHAAPKKPAPAPAPAPAAPARKAATATPSSGRSKSDFVRSFPASVSAREIVDRAKAERIVLDAKYVYKVRARADASPARVRARGRPAARPAPAAPAAPKASTAGEAGSVEVLFRALAAEVGLGRAIAILEGERARVRAILGR